MLNFSTLFCIFVKILTTLAIGRTKIDEHLKRVRLLYDSVAWFDAFNNVTKQQVISWIQDDQLTKKGVNKFDEVIGTYSYVTELITRGKKQAGDHYTLFDTGDFYRSMYVAVLSDSIIIDANAQKGNDNLFEKFGNSIIGLTNENMAKLKTMVRESYIKTARRLLQL